MEYDFFRLNPNDFEHLVQALARKIFGLAMITFGEGRDGGREASFEGSYSLPLQTDISWEGYWIIQAKFKSKAEKDTDHFTWVKRQFEKEMKKFQKKEKDTKVPNNYLLFTNVALSGVEDVGGRDKIEKLKKRFCKLIPNIMIYGCDDLRTLLDNNRDVAAAYASFILPGDILKELLEMLTRLKEKEFNKNNRDYYNIIKRFLHKEFRENLYPKLEQSGEKTERLIKLEQVFIDLYATTSGLVPKDDKSEKKFVELCTHRGNNVSTPDQGDNRFVLVGNFGHGKSTLMQFLCQIYRAFFLKKLSHEKPIKEVDQFINKYCSYRKESIDCFRLPFKIEVNDYASWMSKRKDGQSCSVLSFLKETIKEKADVDDEIGLKDLREIFKSLSCVFVFDGMDEVAIASNKREVVKQINDFVDVELKHLDSDTLIIITTRPQGYKYEFDRQIYDHRFVTDLPQADCLKYLDLLLENIEPNDKKRSKHREILQRAIDDATIAELMKTPLQATIMAILVKSGGKPPKERYSLFDKYYKIIYDRERQRGASRLLEELPEKCYKDIHKIFGLASQKLSETKNAPSASFSGSKFNGLIRSYLEFNEFNEDEIEANSTDIKYDITRRLLFIVEDKQDNIKFSIRALQEYFASLYYFNCREKIFPDRIRQLSRSSYWRNVFLFGMGFIYNEQDYMLDHLYALCSELNGGEQDANINSIERVSKIGSWLALDILVDGVFRNTRRYENKFSEFLKPLFEMAPSEKHFAFAKLSKEIIDNWVVKFIAEFLSQREFKEQLSAWVIAVVLIEHEYEELIEMVTPHWPEEENAIVLIKYLYKMGLYKSGWFTDKVIDALNGNYCERLYSLLDDLMVFENIWEKRNQLNKRASRMLAEVIFTGYYAPLLDYEPERYYNVFFGDRALKGLLENISFTPRYGKMRYLLIADDSAGLKELTNKLAELDLKHLEYMVSAIAEPEKEKTQRFFIELLNLSDERFEYITRFCRKFDIFNILKEIQHKSELKAIVNTSKFEDSLINDIIRWQGVKITKDNIIQILKTSHTGFRSEIFGPKEVLNFFDNIYKKYSKVTGEKNKYLHMELLQIIQCDDLDENWLKNFSGWDEFILAYIKIVKNSRKYKWKHPRALANRYILLIYFVPQEKLLELIFQNREDIFDDLDVLDISQLHRVKEELSNHIFKKASNVLNCTTISRKESSIIRVLLNLIFKEKGCITKTAFEKIDYENLYNFRYGNTENDMCRLCLGIANPVLESNTEIPVDLISQLNQIKTQIQEEKLEKRFFQYVIMTFENLELKSGIQLKFFLEVYAWIPRDLEYLELLSRYETYLIQVSEGLPSGLNDKDVMNKLELDSYLIEDGIF